MKAKILTKKKKKINLNLYVYVSSNRYDFMIQYNLYDTGLCILRFMNIVNAYL